MTTRLALLSDLHGNLHALERVLADAASLGVDGIACLGDVATLGPRPLEVLDVILHHARWFILGNHDEYMHNDTALRAHTRAPAVLSAVGWCRAHLDEGRLRQLAAFEVQRNVELAPGVTVSLFHGSPASNEEDLLADAPLTALDSVTADRGALVFAGGHTHVPMVRQHRGRLVVNPGSVGLPFREVPRGGPPAILGHAEYAVLEAHRGAVSVMLRQVALDRARLMDEARAWDEPLGRELETNYAR